jgi:hypothetical protein
VGHSYDNELVYLGTRFLVWVAFVGATIYPLPAALLDALTRTGQDLIGTLNGRAHQHGDLHFRRRGRIDGFLYVPEGQITAHG